MDYSLLVGIHDCTIPSIPEEEFWDDLGDDDGNGYISSDEVAEPPLSPCAGEKIYIYIEVLSSLFTT